MRKLLLLSSVVLLSTMLGAQTIINVSYDPPTLPEVNAGSDTVINENQTVQLSGSVTGGTPPFMYNWTPEALLNDPNILTPVASPAAPTTFTLSVIDSNECAASDSVFTDVTVNITELSNNMQLKVYPNPTSGMINIEGLPAETKNARVEIYTLNGSSIMNRKLSPSGQSSIDISELKSQKIYMMKIIYDDKEEIRKLMVK